MTHETCQTSHPFQSLKKLRRAVRNFADLLEEGKYMVLVMGDVYLKGGCVPLGFMAMDEIRSIGKFRPKATIIKNITNNRGKFGREHLCEYHALKNGLYIFFLSKGMSAREISPPLFT